MGPFAMPALPLFLCCAIAAYLIGSIPFGYLVARARGIDILSRGSGNIGATNVGRILGRRYGVLVFVLDFAKGAVPVVLAVLLPTPSDDMLIPNILPVTVGVAAFLGHLFPIYLRFRGGKGVATGLGVVSVLAPIPSLIALAVWVIVVLTTRYVSLASLCGGASLCAARLLLVDHPWAPEYVAVTAFCLIGVAFVFVRHTGNIRRLLAGTENRF